MSCAWFLAREGVRVTLLERGRLSREASFGNAGTVSAGHPPLNRPGRVGKALRQMLDSTSPLYVKPRFDPALAAWFAEFAAHCTWSHVSHCMDVMAPLGKEALEWFDRLVSEEDLECGYRREGYFDVCLTHEGLADARHEADIIRGHGYHPETLDGDELLRREPALTPDVVGGVYFPEAATLDPYAFVMEMAERARRLGADLREGVSVTRLLGDDRVHGAVTADGERLEADAVVVATGPFSLDLLRRHGTRIAVQPGKGYHRDLPVGPGGAPPLRVACVLNESSVFCTPMAGGIRFAGTMEFSGLNHVMRPERLEQLTVAAGRYFPTLATDTITSEWCGLRPVAADGLPIVGPLEGVEGLVVATGHGMLGLTLGPVTGRMVRDWILSGGVPGPERALVPGRRQAGQK